MAHLLPFDYTGSGARRQALIAEKPTAEGFSAAARESEKRRASIILSYQGFQGKKSKKPCL
jgi:hypothetical protein